MGRRRRRARGRAAGSPALLTRSAAPARRGASTRSRAPRRWRWRARARAWRARRRAGRQRAPAAAPLRRRGRLRPEDARPRAALPALPGAGARARRRARAGSRFAAGLRRPGAPHARVPAARRAARPPELVALGARPPARRASASDSFKPRGARTPYRAGVMIDERAEALHLGDRAGAGAAALRGTCSRAATRRAVQGRAGAATRPPTAATATRWSPTGAGRPSQPPHIWTALEVLEERGVDRPGRSCDHLADDHRARRRRAASRCRRLEPYPHAPWWGIGTDGHAARHRAALRAAAATGVDHPWMRARRGVLLARGRRDREDAPVRGRGGDHVPRRRVGPRARGGRGRAARRLVREQDLVGTQPEGYSPGEIHHPHDFAPRPDTLARAWFTDAEIEAVARPARRASSARTAAGRSRGPIWTPAIGSSGAGW